MRKRQSKTRKIAYSGLTVLVLAFGSSLVSTSIGSAQPYTTHEGDDCPYWGAGQRANFSTYGYWSNGRMGELRCENGKWRRYWPLAEASAPRS